MCPFHILLVLSFHICRSLFICVGLFSYVCMAHEVCPVHILLVWSLYEKTSFGASRTDTAICGLACETVLRRALMQKRRVVLCSSARHKVYRALMRKRRVVFARVGHLCKRGV